MTTASLEPQSTIDSAPPGRGFGWTLRALGLVAVGSATVAQAIEVAAVGVWTGIEDLIDVARVAGAWSSQLFAAGGLAAAVAMARRLARDPRAVRLRALSLGAAMMLSLSVAVGSGALALLARRLLGERLVTKLPAESGFVLAMALGLFCAASAAAAVRRPVQRGAGLVLAGTCATVFMHTLSTALQWFGSSDLGSGDSLQVLATIEWAALASVAVFSLAWLGSGRDSLPGRSEKFRRWRGGVLVFLALGLSCLGTLYVVRGLRPDARRLEVFMARALEVLLGPIESDVPLTLRAYVEWLRWSVALLAFVLAPRRTLRSASVGYALVGAAYPMAPAGALSLGLAAWCLAVDPGERDATDPPSDANPRSLLALTDLAD